MEDTNTDESQVLETETADTEAAAETSEDTSTEQTDEQLTPEQIKELKEKAAKADDLEKKNKQLFERAKKAEQAKPADGLTGEDALVLAKADVHADDIEAVRDWAKFKKISVAEALKDKDFKAVLETHAEERRTAEATNTNGGARGGSKVSGDDLLAKAEQTGEVPTTTEGMNALFNARMARKTKR